MADHAAGLGLLAGCQRFARRETDGFGGFRGDPGRIGLDREPLQVLGDGRRGLALAGQDRRSPRGRPR